MLGIETEVLSALGMQGTGLSGHTQLAHACKC
ncbi:hypothetical protein ABIA60_002786 [Pseudomonas frederiksbergensis]